MRRRGVVLAAAVAATAPACGAKTEDLPPHGEALFVVDTDLAVPALAGRLRVDVFAEDGAWLDSRDIGRSDPRDWPASFGVYSDDDTRPRRALVRLRAYPEGSLRPYAGERNVPPPPFAPPRAPSTLDELCAGAPDLAIGGHASGRMGATVVEGHAITSDCPNPAAGGAFAARVTIATAGTYRFDVSTMSPFTSQATLSLRASCKDSSSQLACVQLLAGPGSFSTAHFPRLDATLAPGTYSLLVTGTIPNWPADATVEALPVDADVVVPPEPPPATPPIAPRLLIDGQDRTPATEPVAPATVDRLVLVRLVPGVRGSVRVTLRGACVGTNALLGGRDAAVDPAAATTCVDAEGQRVPVVETALDPSLADGGASAAGSFPAPAPCADADTTPDRVCIPGGAFLFGTRQIQPTDTPLLRSSPERIAVMPRMWIDRHEVTVARFRAALARGFGFGAGDVTANEAPIPATVDAATVQTLAPWCTWSATPREREDHPLNCVAWSLARAFCRAEGGDLPSEAEWEYTAAAVGRAFKTPYPWGADAAECDRGVFSRWSPDLGGAPPCPGFALGTASVLEDVGPGRLPDVSPQGVSGLAGNVAEWTIDSAHGLGDACWSNAGLVSPRCDEADAPYRTLRGGSFYGPPLPITLRQFAPTGYGGRDVPGAASADPSNGFRCVYHEAPR